MKSGALTDTCWWSAEKTCAVLTRTSAGQWSSTADIFCYHKKKVSINVAKFVINERFLFIMKCEWINNKSQKEMEKVGEWKNIFEQKLKIALGTILQLHNWGALFLRSPFSCVGRLSSNGRSQVIMAWVVPPSGWHICCEGERKVTAFLVTCDSPIWLI